MLLPKLCSSLLSLTLLACAGAAPAPLTPTRVQSAFLTEFYDGSRARRIPVALYGAGGRPKPLAVISHGWGGKHTAYSFLAESLVRRGYLVASIQHQLPGDADPPTEGNLAVVRRPMWQAGVDNIQHVQLLLRGLGVVDASQRTLLLGHSHGGDISMLFASLHPETVSAVFSLDNRRMPLPRVASPRICSVRSSDLPADAGVLPSDYDQHRLGMVIRSIGLMAHNDMWDGAMQSQKEAMLAVLDRCLRGLKGRGET